MPARGVGQRPPPGSVSHGGVDADPLFLGSPSGSDDPARTMLAAVNDEDSARPLPSTHTHSDCCASVFFFASTWGASTSPAVETAKEKSTKLTCFCIQPGAWVLIGEIFPLPIRSRGVALSTSSN